MMMIFKPAEAQYRGKIPVYLLWLRFQMTRVPVRLHVNTLNVGVDGMSIVSRYVLAYLTYYYCPMATCIRVSWSQFHLRRLWAFYFLEICTNIVCPPQLSYAFPIKILLAVLSSPIPAAYPASYVYAYSIRFI